MFTWYTVATGVVILGFALNAYNRTRDALHPAIVMSPLFLYMYCLWPLALNRHGSLYQYFSPGQLEYVSLLYLLAITSLYLGLVHRPKSRDSTGLSLNVFGITIDERTRKQIAGLSIFLGVLAVGAFLYKISNVGGFEAAYGRAKGGGYAVSGYVSESVLFSFPAVLLYAISRRAERVTAFDIVVAVVIMVPHLMQGILGGRRGPIFLALATLFVSWFIAKRRAPKMKTAIIGIGLCGLAVIFVWSQRQDVYLGSGGQYQSGACLGEDSPGRGGVARQYICGGSSDGANGKEALFFLLGLSLFCNLFHSSYSKADLANKI